MANQIVADTFEKLGQQGGQVIQQVVKEPAKVVEAATKQTGVKPTESGVEQPQDQTATSQQLAAKNTASRRLLSNLEGELKVLRQKREQELEQRRAPVQEQQGEGEKIKQLGVLKPGEKAKDPDQLPPPLAAAKRKGPERLKGVSG